MNTASIQQEPTTEIPTSSWRELMFITMKLRVGNAKFTLNSFV